jgi:hypothetical protein
MSANVFVWIEALDGRCLSTLWKLNLDTVKCFQVSTSPCLKLLFPCLCVMKLEEWELE